MESIIYPLRNPNNLPRVDSHRHKRFVNSPDQDSLLGPNMPAWRTASTILESPKASTREANEPLIGTTNNARAASNSDGPIENHATLTKAYHRPINRREIKLPYAPTLARLLIALDKERAENHRIDSLTKIAIVNEHLRVLMHQLEFVYSNVPKVAAAILDDLSHSGYSYPFSVVVKELFVALLNEFDHTAHLTQITAFLDIQSTTTVQIIWSTEYTPANTIMPLRPKDPVPRLQSYNQRRPHTR